MGPPITKGLVTPRGKSSWARWLLALVTTLIAGFLLYQYYLAQPLQEAILAEIPLGSEVKRLRSLAQERGVVGGNVMRWIPSSGTGPDRDDIQLRVDGVIIKTDFGLFRQENLGEYSSWSPSREEEADFSGEVMFFVGDSVMLGFSYLHGKLVKKDWGYLPG